MFGHNQLVISLADLQVHLNRWRGSANYRRSFSAPRILLVSQFPKFVGDTTHGDFHSLSVSDRHAPANQRLSSAGTARSYWLSGTDWYGLLFGHNQRAISFALRFCIGTLEPISGLVQLEQLYLYDCRNLTGTICCSGTTTT